MKKWILFSLLPLLSFITACSTAPVTESQPPAEVQKPESPAVLDFGDYWTGTIYTDENSSGDSTATARFSSEWTRGEDAGNVYPKKFVSVESVEEVEMDFRWDNGGSIPEGTYDVYVSIDGLPGEGWIRNLHLKAGTGYEVIMFFSAAKIDISLETDGDDIFVYPSGTFTEYEQLGRLDDIPREKSLTWVNSYSENNEIWWLMPAGVPVDVAWHHSDGSVDRYPDFTAVPESFVKNFQ
jgi:hypothetical protein